MPVGLKYFTISNTLCTFTKPQPSTVKRPNYDRGKEANSAGNSLPPLSPTLLFHPLASGPNSRLPLRFPSSGKGKEKRQRKKKQRRGTRGSSPALQSGHELGIRDRGQHASAPISSHTFQESKR